MRTHRKKQKTTNKAVMINLVQLSLFCISFFIIPLSQAYYSTMNTGEVISNKRSRFMGEFQYVTSRQQLNLIGRYEQGINEGLSYQLIGGIGATLLEAGAFMKWVPIPDLKTQPAIGGLLGVFMARADGARDFSFRFHPFVSKQFYSSLGDFNAYAALPLGYTVRGDESGFPVHLVAGTAFYRKEMQGYRGFVEIGAAINFAFPYISFGVEFDFDGSTPTDF